MINAADVVVNLAGSPTVGNPHSKAWARELREQPGHDDPAVLARRDRRAPTTRPAFLAGNGISYYGDHGDQVLDRVLRQPRATRCSPT